MALRVGAGGKRLATTQAGVLVRFVNGDPADAAGLRCASTDQLQCGESLYSKMAQYWAKPKATLEYDEPFYSIPLDKAASSVEYGIGAGRLMAKLHPTFGVDSSSEMVQQCTELSPGTRLIVGDIRRVRLPRLVDYSYAAGGTMNNFLSLEHLADALRNVLKNSNSVTEFRFDLISQNMFESGLEAVEGKWFVIEGGDAPNTRERYIRQGPREYLHEYVMDFGTAQSKYAHIHERWFPPEEVLGLLRKVGYADAVVQTSPVTSTFSSRSHQHFYIARR